MGDKLHDVIIIGGSAAGISAAMTLGRSLRNVLIIDSKTPCNRNSKHSHNFITNDGKAPKEIIDNTNKELLHYETVSIIDGTVLNILHKDNEFHVATSAGKLFIGKKILLCTGLTDICPDIPGFSECWGNTILHCPYCNGYEHRNEPTAILANGEAAYHLGILINNWTKDIIILTNGISELRNEEVEKLASRNITINYDVISEFKHENGKIEAILFDNGKMKHPTVLYASIEFEQQNDLAEKLGCKMSSHGHIDVDDEQRTSIDGVYAAGDCTDQQRAIAVAAASGTKAGFTINLDLILK